VEVPEAKAASACGKNRVIREISLSGCRMIGKGDKASVYRYDDELVIKVYNGKSTLQDVEREIEMSRKAFVLGLPTAISFGIVKVEGHGYGSMFELLEADTVSQLIARHPEDAGIYAAEMAGLAKRIHHTEVRAGTLRDGQKIMEEWIDTGIGRINPALGTRLLKMIRELPETCRIVHGDFHTGNVFRRRGELMLIDMDRMGTGNPVVDFSLLYLAYIGFGELDPGSIKEYMGFSYETAKEFYRRFCEAYFGAGEERIREASGKAALMCYTRMVSRLMREGRAVPEMLPRRIEELAGEVRDLVICE